MAKKLFYIIASNRKLKIDTFITITCQIEQLLNSRPLTPVSSDITDTESLTPGHFLTGHTTGIPSDSILDEHSATKLRTSWTTVRNVMEELWKRLLKEFLPTLRPRRRWHHTIDPLDVGDLVWILEPNAPRGIWPVGRIQEIHKGKDGVARSATVITTKGTFLKPAVKLSLVEEK